MKKPLTLPFPIAAAAFSLSLVVALVGCDYMKNFGYTPSKSEREAHRGTPLRAAETYIHAMAEGNRDLMVAAYAEQVAVIRGSALLDEKYGGLGGEDGTAKTRLVSLEELKEGYRRAIERMGDAAWARRKSRVLAYERRFIGLTDTRARGIVDDFQTQPNDRVLLVHPQGPIMLFLFREDPERGWLVVAEYWTE